MVDNSDLDRIFERVEAKNPGLMLTLAQTKMLTQAIQWEIALNQLANRNFELKPGKQDTQSWEVPGFKLRMERKPHQVVPVSHQKDGLCDITFWLHTDIPYARGFIRAQNDWNVADMMDYLSHPTVFTSMYQPSSYVCTISIDNLLYGIYSLRHGFRAEKCLEMQPA